VSTSIVATVDPAGGRVDARTEQGQLIAMDGDPPHGDDAAAGPKEALLAALAGCTAIDVAAILRKKQQRASTYEIAVSAESAEEHPRVFTSVTVEHRFTGEMEAEAIRRSIELSSTRYCPVSAMLSRAVTIEHWYLLIRDQHEPVRALVAVTGPAGHRVL
jgi:putative redox protein